MKVLDFISGKSKRRAELIAQRESLLQQQERESAERLGQIAALELDTDYQVYLSALRVQAAIRKLQDAHFSANARARERLEQIDAAIAGEVDPRVAEFLHWASDERARIAKEENTGGVLTYSRAGLPQGKLLTNAPKIEAYISALDVAIHQAKKLAASDDAAAALAKIKANLPVPDVSTEEIETSPAMAFCLS